MLVHKIIKTPIPVHQPWQQGVRHYNRSRILNQQDLNEYLNTPGLPGIGDFVRYRHMQHTSMTKWMVNVVVDIKTDWDGMTFGSDGQPETHKLCQLGQIDLQGGNAFMRWSGTADYVLVSEEEALKVCDAGIQNRIKELLAA